MRAISFLILLNLSFFTVQNTVDESSFYEPFRSKQQSYYAVKKQPLNKTKITRFAAKSLNLNDKDREI